MEKDEELARLESVVYSRAGSAESAGTGSLAMPPLAPGPGSPPRRRFALPLVAAAAFVAGIVLALLVTSAHNRTSGLPEASETAAVALFDLPPRYPELPVPDLGDQFAAASVRNVSGTSSSDDGFGVYLGRETGSNLYCLIVHTDSELSVSTCSSADDVARKGLRVRAAVTVRSPVAYGVADGETEVTAALTTRGEFSMSFPPPGEQPATEPLPTSLEPPATPDDTILGTWTSENGDFQATLDAHGEGVVVALVCLGDGSVTVDLSDGSSTHIDCTSVRVESGGLGMNMAFEAFDVTVFTTGSVIWGLTIASTPVTEATG